MAAHKRTRTRKRVSSYHHFPEVKGKVVELVEIDQDANAILILFDDNTALGFDLDSNHVVFPELSNRKKGEWKTIKQWPSIHSPISMVKWP
jgi:hypothetical protein